MDLDRHLRAVSSRRSRLATGRAEMAEDGCGQLRTADGSGQFQTVAEHNGTVCGKTKRNAVWEQVSMKKISELCYGR